MSIEKTIEHISKYTGHSIEKLDFIYQCIKQVFTTDGVCGIETIKRYDTSDTPYDELYELGLDDDDIIIGFYLLRELKVKYG